MLDAATQLSILTEIINLIAVVVGIFVLVSFVVMTMVVAADGCRKAPESRRLAAQRSPCSRTTAPRRLYLVKSTPPHAVLADR